MKTCKACGTEIINGVNGCAMYNKCFRCRPISYPAQPKRNAITSWEDMDVLEAKCLTDPGI